MNSQQLQNDKLTIINWISQLQDYSLVEKVKSIMSSPDACSLSDEQKNSIDEALQSIEAKGIKPHNTVMEETKKRFPHLYNR
jgi:Zn-dependent oligopeptidase